MSESSDEKRAATLRAAAGRATIDLPAELFPTEGLLGVHDPLSVRVLLLDSGDRLALISAELTSLPEEQVTALRIRVGALAELPSENVWVCVTHTMSAPHFVPEHMCKTQADRRKNLLLSQALETAVDVAVSQAAAGLEEARVGCGLGWCDINVNRDIPTSEGWWLGGNESGFSDKTVTVLRFETVGGRPVAILFSHSVRPAVMERPLGSESDGLVTADLVGVACALVEEKYGPGTTALFLMGAAGDQAPALRGADFTYAGTGGSLRSLPTDERGYVVAQMIGARLGAEVLRLAEASECRACWDPITLRTAEIAFAGQKLPETRPTRPTRQYEFVPDQERVVKVEIARIGEIVLIGVAPELSCETGVALREQSPLGSTLVLTMVNGAYKYMADVASYDRITYEAMNSPFARGSAERLVEKTVGLLRRMSG